MQRVGEVNPDLQVLRASRARGARAIVVGGLAPAEGRARSTGGIHHLEWVGKPPSVIVNGQKPDGKTRSSTEPLVGATRDSLASREFASIAAKMRKRGAQYRSDPRPPDSSRTILCL